MVTKKVFDMGENKMKMCENGGLHGQIIKARKR